MNPSFKSCNAPLANGWNCLRPVKNPGDRCYQHSGKPKPIPPLLLQAYKALKMADVYVGDIDDAELCAAIEAEYPSVKEKV